MDFFNSLIGFVEILFDFVSNLVTSLLALFNLLGTVIVLPGLFAGCLFPILLTSFLVVVSIGVLYKVVGR